MRQAWKHITVSLLTGMLIGAALSNLWISRQRSHRHDRGEKRSSRMLKRFSSKLDLNPEQRKEVAAILKKKRVRIKELRAKIHPEFKSLRRTTREEIRGILNPEQLKKFERIHSKWEARWKKRHAKEK